MNDNKCKCKVPKRPSGFTITEGFSNKQTPVVKVSSVCPFCKKEKVIDK